MLEYQPIHLHIGNYPDMDARRHWREAQEIKDSQIYQLLVKTRNENHTIASDSQVKEQSWMAATKRLRRQQPKASNLILVQNHQRNKNYGRKLDPQWIGPRLLVKTTFKRITGYVKELYGNGTLKKYHLDNFLM